MQLLEKNCETRWEMGEVLTADIAVKISDTQLICLKSGTKIDQNVKEILERTQDIFTFKEELASIDTLMSQITHDRCKTLLQKVKRFKNDPAKVFSMLFYVNEQMFLSFEASSQNKIDLDCANVLVDSLIYLTKYDTYHLKNSMPRLLDEYKLCVHSFNVAYYALQLGVLLGLNDDELKQLGLAGLLHDVGKKKVESVIDKNMILEMTEFEMIQKHSEYSVEILKENGINDPIVLEAILQHHERYDGSGYPKGIYKEQIGRFGSILAICDVFDAMTVERPYRDRYSSFESLRLMITDVVLKKQFNHNCIKKLLISIGTD